MSLSCIQCARRKVRCDRATPVCSTCRKRPGDVCEYPIPYAKETRMSVNEQSERIAKLEQYIRAFGGNPNHVECDLTFGPNRPDEHLTPNHPPTESLEEPTIIQEQTGRGTKRKNDDATAPKDSAVQEKDTRARRQSRLVEHEEQTTYLDAPMWYSWNEAKQIGSETRQRSEERRAKPKAFIARCNTLLDPVDTGSRAELDKKHPSTDVVVALWEKFLKNVHPLVKIIFDWDKAPLIQRASADATALSRGENAFMFTMYFLTVLSLSDKDCQQLFNNESKSELLDEFQAAAETALVAAGFMATSELLVLQAFMLYLLAMRDRARPATWFSLQGIAVRIAQRLGIHRDGSFLGLSPFQAEERRRVWWQLQHMEILVCIIVGCLSMTVYGTWDTKMPANIEDEDLDREMTAMPVPRRKLTSMSHCLWRYTLMRMQRDQRMLQPEHDSIIWALSPNIPVEEKDAKWEPIEREIGQNFLLDCDLLNPLQLHMQIGIRSCFLASRRLSRQPGLANARILVMPKKDRDELLAMNVKNLEYYVLAETTPLIEQFRWHNTFYFQWTAFVFVILEAHHRAATPDAVSLWTLINKLCQLHPSFTGTVNQPGITTMGRLVVLAWDQRRKHLQSQGKEVEKPECVTALEEKLDFYPDAPDVANKDMPWFADDFMPSDFDMIDWSFLEKEMGADMFASN